MNVKKVFLLTLPVAAAYGPLGLAFGVYLTTANVAWYWAPISAFMIFAGSIEFLAVSFMLSGYSFFSIAFSTFIINFRHIFYGLSFPYDRLKNFFQKTYGIWALTDETYGITSAGDGRHLSGPEITLLQVTSHFWWVGSAFLGSLIGLVIPPEITGFDFALTTMFIILSLDAIREAKDNSLLIFVIVAASFGIAFEKIILENSFLTVSLCVYLMCNVIKYKVAE